MVKPARRVRRAFTVARKVIFTGSVTTGSVRPAPGPPSTKSTSMSIRPGSRVSSGTSIDLVGVRRGAAIGADAGDALALDAHVGVLDDVAAVDVERAPRVDDGHTISHRSPLSPSHHDMGAERVFSLIRDRPSRRMGHGHTTPDGLGDLRDPVPPLGGHRAGHARGRLRGRELTADRQGGRGHPRAGALLLRHPRRPVHRGAPSTGRAAARAPATPARPLRSPCVRCGRRAPTSRALRC